MYAKPPMMFSKALEKMAMQNIAEAKRMKKPPMMKRPIPMNRPIMKINRPPTISMTFKGKTDN